MGLSAPLRSAERDEVVLRIVRLPTLDLVLWVCGISDPTQEFWEGAMQTLSAHKKAFGKQAPLHSLVVTDAGAPNAKQRSELVKVCGADSPFAVVTDSIDTPIKKGIATALTWVFPRIGFFGTDRFDDALKHVGALGHDGRVWAELRQMARRHATLRAIASSARFPYDG